MRGGGGPQGGTGTAVYAVTDSRLGPRGLWRVQGGRVVQLAGLAHTPPQAPSMRVCVSGSWCVLAGCVLAAPPHPSDTTTVGPLWISFTHTHPTLLLFSLTCFLPPGRGGGTLRPYPTFPSINLDAEFSWASTDTFIRSRRLNEKLIHKKIELTNKIKDRSLCRK